MATIVESAREAVRERFEPALDCVQEQMRDARRAAVRGQHAVEDFAAGTALQIRRRPLTSMALATAAGAIAGCVVGFVLVNRAHYRRYREYKSARAL
ncbi:MAG: hypothetical protein ABI634_09725 [Acidobacteriota bacterium]